MSTFEPRLRRHAAWVTGDAGANWAFRGAIVVTAAVYYVIGRHQWFVRDDWGWVVSRNSVRDVSGWKSWLFEGQDGHWMTVPILLWRGIQNVFHLGSYWPFLIPTMAVHVVAVLLVRALCRRAHVSAWTTTLVCALLLVFGSGWDNIVFAIQITYNLSIVAFLAQVLLVDHDGAPNRRDIFAAVLGVIGVMSSGFGPIFIAGVALLLILQCRWKQLAIVVLPQALACAWWFVFWGGDPAAAKMPGPRSQVPAYVVRGVVATFEGIVGIATLGGLALVATFAVTLWRGRTWRLQSMMLTLWATVVMMFAAIGLERIGFGVPTAASSRYVHVAGILLMPTVALAIDSLGRIAREARWAGWALVATSAVLNVGWLHVSSAEWANQSQEEKRLFELVVGSGYLGQVDPTIAPAPKSPNVTVGWLAYMLGEHAIGIRAPSNEADVHLVRVALKLEPAPPAVTVPPSP